MSKLAILNYFTWVFFSPINKIGQIHHHFTKYFNCWHTCVSTIKKFHGTKFINLLSQSGFWREKKLSKNENMGIPRQRNESIHSPDKQPFPTPNFFLAELQPQGWDTLRCSCGVRLSGPHWSALVWTGWHPLHVTPGISPWIIALPFLPGSLHRPHSAEILRWDVKTQI